MIVNLCELALVYDMYKHVHTDPSALNKKNVNSCRSNKQLTTKCEMGGLDCSKCFPTATKFTAPTIVRLEQVNKAIVIVFAWTLAFPTVMHTSMNFSISVRKSYRKPLNNLVHGERARHPSVARSWVLPIVRARNVEDFAEYRQSNVLFAHNPMRMLHAFEYCVRQCTHMHYACALVTFIPKKHNVQV